VPSLYEGEIDTLNGLPYQIDTNDSWVKETDIIKYLCESNGTFYMEYFQGETYLNVNNIDGKFPLINVLVAAHEVFDVISDKENKNKREEKYLKATYPYILQLAKIGAREIDGDHTPISLMEAYLTGSK